jgi:hypothetical protein
MSYRMTPDTASHRQKREVNPTFGWQNGTAKKKAIYFIKHKEKNAKISSPWNDNSSGNLSD